MPILGGMKHPVILSLMTALFILSAQIPPCEASAKTEADIKNYLRQGAELLRKADWDGSQRAFLRASKSPRVEDRIEAYEGLAALYRKLRMTQKEARVIRSLEKEKAFQKKLLPETESFYEAYKLVKGDTYAKIASRRKISEEWLKRVNGHKLLVEGKTIRIPKQGYTLVVDKKARKLFWKRGKETLKTYPVSIGREETETPEGEFRVKEKIKNPVWYRMNQVFPPDSPKNLLGTRWLGLDQKGYGIHGTRHPNSIGSAASHGCIRMFNHDVEELFSWVPIGTPVIIRTSSSSVRPHG